jgi:hypothetical protein
MIPDNVKRRIHNIWPHLNENRGGYMPPLKPNLLAAAALPQSVRFADYPELPLPRESRNLIINL